MSYQKDKNKIMKELLRESDAELTDEELVKEILGTTIAENSEKTKRFRLVKKPPTPSLGLRVVGLSYSALSA